MINFFNDDIRERFHLLPIDVQREITAFAEGRMMTLVFVDYYDGILDVTLRLGH